MQFPFPRRPCLLALAVAVSAAAAHADVTPAPLFCDHAVLQQGIAVPVWGNASPGEEVSVSFVGQEPKTTADDQGHWTVRLQPLHAGDAGTLQIKGKNTLIFNDVVAGEVWFCSGQSNMGFTVKEAADAEHEIAAANYPQIREYHEPLKPSGRPEDFTFSNSSWKPCTPANAKEFSAVGYFFAREISQTVGVPVGVINSSWGGTPIYPWIDISILRSAPALYADLMEQKRRAAADWPAAEGKWKDAVKKWELEASEAKAAGQPFTKGRPWASNPSALQNMPAGLTNGMLHPLLPYAIRGALWYQGESNAERDQAGAAEYAQWQPMMIRNWRDLWSEGDFPFYFVQLPNWKVSRSDATPDTWAYFREAQARTLATLPNVGMAVTIDVGESGNIHPKNKQSVGHRLALIAEANTYGKPAAWAAPAYRSMKVMEAGKIRVEFDHAEGLTVKGGGELNNFTVSGEDMKFVPATAKIEDGGVVVSSPAVSAPVAVRYAWTNDPQGINLYNGAGLPASSFRTDGAEADPVASR